MLLLSRTLIWGISDEKSCLGCGAPCRRIAWHRVGCRPELLLGRGYRGGASDSVSDRSYGDQFGLSGYGLWRIQVPQQGRDYPLSERDDRPFPPYRSTECEERLRCLANQPGQRGLPQTSRRSDRASLPAIGRDAEARQHLRREGISRLRDCPRGERHTSEMHKISATNGAPDAAIARS